MGNDGIKTLPPAGAVNANLQVNETDEALGEQPELTSTQSEQPTDEMTGHPTRLPGTPGNVTTGGGLEPVAGQIGAVVGAQATKKVGFWQKLRDALLEIVTFGIKDTQTYNGKIDSDHFRDAAAELVRTSTPQQLAALREKGGSELWDFLMQEPIWRQTPDLSPQQRQDIAAALYQGINGELSATGTPTQQAVADGRDLPAARVEQLNEYAAAQLDAAQAEIDQKLQFLGVTDARPLNQSYMVNLSSDYFPAGSLESPEQVEALQQQIQNTVAFLKRLHIDNEGQPTSLFRFVELVPESHHGERSALKETLSDQPLRLDGHSLHVRIPDPDRLLQGDYDPIALETLQAAWAEGSFFTEERLQQVWPYVNPTGEVRSTLRKAVLPRIRQLAQRIRGLGAGSGDETATRGELLGHIRNELSVAVPGIITGAASLRELALRRLEGATAEQLAAFRSELAGALSDPTLQEHATNAAVMASAQGVHRDVSKRVRQFTLIGANVENLHQIEVMARFAPDAGMRGYLPQSDDAADASPRTEIDVVQFNLIGANVSTHDFVDVSVELSRGVLSAAAIDQALARVFG